MRERGLEPGQTVAIMLPTCADFFFTFAGILFAGGIPVPIYPPFRADRIAEYATRQSNILRNAEARFLVTWRQAENLAKLLQPRVPTLREVLNVQKLGAAGARGRIDGTKAPVDAAKQWRAVEHLSHHARGDEIAFLQYTSGSTGDPKGVVLTHANLLANIRSIISGIHVQASDVCVSWLPLYHDMGLIGAWFVPIFTGVRLVVMSPLAFLSRPERWLRAIQRHRATISPAPNFAYELCVRKIADKDLQGLDLSSWRAAINGAEPVRVETLERFATRFAPYGFRRSALMPVYGLAEGSLAVSVPQMGAGYKVDRIDRAQFESAGRAEPVSAAGSDVAALEFVDAGKPLPGVEVRIVDADGRDAGERREGRLWFRGAAATSGYYHNEAATRELLRDENWLDSGDLAYAADGDLYITGRAKDMIIKAGRNLYPHEVEEIAGRVAGVRTGCVVAFGAPDERTGTERLVVAAELRDAASAKRIEGRNCERGGGGDGNAAGRHRDAACAIHSEDFEREIAAQRNAAAISGRKAGQKATGCVGADCEAGGERRGAARWALAAGSREGSARILVWRIRAHGFLGGPDSALGRGGLHARSQARGTIRTDRRAHDAGCGPRACASGRRRNSGGTRAERAMDFRAESFQLSGYSGDPGISSAPRCGSFPRAKSAKCPSSARLRSEAASLRSTAPIHTRGYARQKK